MVVPDFPPIFGLFAWVSEQGVYFWLASWALFLDARQTGFGFGLVSGWQCFLYQNRPEKLV